MGAVLAVGWNLVPATPGAAGSDVAGAGATTPVADRASQGSVRTAGVGNPAFADIIERVKPAVVTIIVERDATPAMKRAVADQGPQRGQRGQEGLDEFFERFFGPNGPGIPGAPQGRGPRSGGQGSGFIIDERGYVVTNNHVVSGADTVKVVLDDGTELRGKVVGTDAATDLALIKIDGGKKLRAVEFGDSDRARVGDWVVAIGNPFGFGGTATVGIISARGRDLRAGPYDDFLQVDAAINSGNSGGPVFDASGRVIGVNTAIYSPNGGNVGLGFAIPATQVKVVVAELRNGGKVHRGWLGVQIQDLTPELARSVGLAAAEGALVADVVAGSPAQKSGVRAGDVIRRYGETPIKNAKDLSRRVAATDKGHDVLLEVWRDNRAQKLKVDIGAQAPTLAEQDDVQPDAGSVGFG